MDFDMNIDNIVKIRISMPWLYDSLLPERIQIFERTGFDSEQTEA